MLHFNPPPQVSPMSNQIPDLDRLRWQKRVVLVFTESDKDTAFEEQMRSWENLGSEIGERDIQMFTLSGTDPETVRLRDKLHVGRHPFAFVLVGKDGSVKLRRFEPVKPADVFGLIDSMPMRQAEAHDRSRE
jgi:hypothetical protein